MPLDEVVAVVSDLDVTRTMAPGRTEAIAGFTARTGHLSRQLDLWKDHFLADIHDLPGS